MEIIRHQDSHKISTSDWNKQSLRKCLLALGFTDAEIRFRKGSRFVLENWTGEEKDLLKLVKDKWKERAVYFHEANHNDPEQWKNVNSLYSAILKKIHKYIRTYKENCITYECIICGKLVTKFVTSKFQLDSKLCGSDECWRQHHNSKARKRRALFKRTYERYCIVCGNRFFAKDSRQKYDKIECREERNNQWKRDNKHKFKKIAYAEKKAKWTPEQIEREKIRCREKAAKQRLTESPEQREERLRKLREKAKEMRKLYPQKYKRKKISRAEKISKKLNQFKDKLWMFEAWLEHISSKSISKKMRNKVRQELFNKLLIENNWDKQKVVDLMGISIQKLNSYIKRYQLAPNKNDDIICENIPKVMP